MPSKDIEYFKGRQYGRTYLSKSFDLKRSGSKDDGKAARFIHKVIRDTGDEAGIVEFDGTSHTICERSGGKVQFKLLVAQDCENIKDIWIHSIRIDRDGNEKLDTLVRFNSHESRSLLELFYSLKYLPIEGPEKVSIDSSQIRSLLQLLVDDPSLMQSSGFDIESLSALIESNADAKDVVAMAGRKRAIEKFRLMVDDKDYFNKEKVLLGVEGDEAVWQSFFESQPWILGAGLSHQLFVSFDENKLEQIVRGGSVFNYGKRADALLKTSGLIKSLVFAEIKTPEAKLLSGDRKGYRPGVWAPSKELVGGISQVQATVQAAQLEIGVKLQAKNRDGSESFDNTYLYQPKSFLIIGSLQEFVGEGGGHCTDKYQCFELFRRNVQSPEIITYDELLSKAEWLVNISESV